MLSGMLVIGGIGLIASLLLGIASKIFYVAVDPTVLAIQRSFLVQTVGPVDLQAAQAVQRSLQKEGQIQMHAQLVDLMWQLG